jgi:hypothetical protein
MAEETFGVSLEQHLANRAGLDTTPAAQGMWQKYVGGPTGQLAQGALGPVQTAASEVASGTFNPSRVLQSFRPSGEEPGTMAQALNPWQTPTQAGITVGTAGAGGLASQAGLSTAKQAGARILGAGAGGGLGGAAEGGAGGAAVGTGIGLLSGGIGEGIGAAADYLRQIGVERTKRWMQEIDAKKMGEAIEAIPKLKGVFAGIRDAAGLEDLAKGATVRQFPDGNEKVMYKGYALLSDYVEKQDQMVEATLAKAQQQYGRTYQFPDALNPGQYTTWDKARHAYSELGRKAYGGVKGQPLEPTIAGVDSKQLHAETGRLIRAQLKLADPSGASLQAFNDGQGVFEAGRYLLKDVLRPAFKSKTTGVVGFNSDVVQNKLTDGRVKAMQKLGVDGFNTVAPAVRMTPDTIGQADVYQPTGAAAALAGVVPLPGAAYARVHVGRPSLVAPGGINPLNMQPNMRTGISLGTEQLVGPGLQNLLPPAQGIPGLQ